MTDERKLRVLHVVPSVGRQAGGLTSAVIGLAAALQDHGIDISIHTTDAATPAQARETRRGLTSSDLPDRFEELDIALHPMTQPYRLSYAPRMLPALKSAAANCDLVHIHGLFLYPQYAAWKASRATDTPYLVSTHGMLHPHFQRRGRLRKTIVDRLWQKQMLRRASVLHATSQVEETALKVLDLGPPITVIPNGLSVSMFSDVAQGRPFRSTYGISDEVPLIMCHGRITAVKGLDLLIDALALVKQRHVDSKLAVVGPDDERLSPSLCSHAESRGVADSLIFTGPLHGYKLREAINAADVWALLSHSDSFGLAALEAMAAGTAVVASKYVDIAPDASRYEALVMVDTDAAEAAAAINGLLDSRAIRESIARHARDYACKYEWATVAESFVELYESLLAHRRSESETRA